MDAQVILAVLGTAAGIVSAYYGYLQYQKSRGTAAHGVPTDAPPDRFSPQKETKLWSVAVDRAIANFRKTRHECHIEIVEQKNFNKSIDRFSTSELVLHVKYPDTGNQEAVSFTHRFDLKINKDGDILEIASKGKRSTDKEKFR